MRVALVSLRVIIAIAVSTYVGHVNAEEPLQIYTVNYPLQYLAQQIAGKHAIVVYPGPAGQDPAFWNPDIETIQEYQDANLILINGAGYAKWVSRVSLPRSRLVDTSRTFSNKLIETSSAKTHSHGPKGNHSHGEIAFTTWLDLEQALQQADSVRLALLELSPINADDYNINFNELSVKLNSLHELFLMAVKGAGQLPILASHPVYQYMARAYDLNLVSVDWEPEFDPDPEQWEELVSILNKHPARIMIWEAPPQAATESRLADMGIKTIVFDPCAVIPDQGDFLSVMERNISELAKDLRLGPDR